MFKKLLKYDMMSVWRLWWIAATVVPVAAVVGSLMFRFILSEINSGESDGIVMPLLRIAAVLTMFACIIAIVLSFVLTMVLVYVRFYKNLFTDEGYLTFTLPVSRKQLLLSKTLNAFIWYVLHGLLIAAALLIFLLFAIPPENGAVINTEIIKAIGDFFSMLWDEIGAWTLLICAELIVWLLVSTLMGIALFHLSITVGSVITKKAKIFVAVAIYYAFNTVVSMLWQMIFPIFVYVMMPGMSALMPSVGDGEVSALISLVLVIAIAFTGIVAMILYNLTQYLLDRKLNLA